jgi:ATP-dependent RNA helicase HelY
VLASGHNLDGEMPAGDFVRWARQVVDLLGQVAEAASATPKLREAARAAMGAVNRGVLAYNAVS